MKPIRIELPTGFQVGSVNAYLFTEPEPILIDCGVKSDASWQALIAGLAEHNLTPSDLHQIIITHPHVDHFGQVDVLAEHSSADVLISELGVDWLTDTRTMWAKRIAYYRDDFLPKVAMSADMINMVAAYMQQSEDITDPLPRERITTFPLDGALMMGGLSWQVIHTPGHASHQTCFYQAETKQFISADMLLAKTPTPVVERPLPPHHQRIPGLHQFLDSLDLVSALDIDTVYPGHGEPFGDHRQLIQYQRDRIHMRKEQCYDAIAAGHHTVYDLTAQLYSTQPPELRFAGMWMTVGYLDLLKAEKRIIEQEIDGVWQYTLMVNS